MNCLQQRAFYCEITIMSDVSLSYFSLFVFDVLSIEQLLVYIVIFINWLKIYFTGDYLLSLPSPYSDVLNYPIPTEKKRSFSR